MLGKVTSKLVEVLGQDVCSLLVVLKLDSLRLVQNMLLVELKENSLVVVLEQEVSSLNLELKLHS